MGKLLTRIHWTLAPSDRTEDTFFEASIYGIKYSAPNCHGVRTIESYRVAVRKIQICTTRKGKNLFRKRRLLFIVDGLHLASQKNASSPAKLLARNAHARHIPLDPELARRVIQPILDKLQSLQSPSQ